MIVVKDVVGLKVNVQLTKIMTIGKRHEDLSMKLDNEKLKGNRLWVYGLWAVVDT